MSGSTRIAPTREFLAALRQRLHPGSDCISFDRFMECALYHPQLGYYNRDQPRVGHRSAADFYTASSLGKVFSKLVLTALEHLAGQPLEAFTFVEIGPESPAGILTALPASPFRESHQLRRGDPLAFPTPSIVFSNELFDAQPFRRLVFHKGRWRELGVRIDEAAIDWCLLPDADIPQALPAETDEGYLVDWPSGAHSLLQELLQEDWNGLFVAFDYGLGLEDILHQRPRGTARSYSAHKMGSDLLDRPGEIDLTCHLAWDVLESILRQNGFSGTRVDFQEAFFMHFAQAAIREIIEDSAGRFSRDQQTLMELIHPGNMGRKFQVLHAKRGID